MAENNHVWPVEILNKGITTYRRDISNVFDLDKNTKNISMGRAEGYAPRYGMAPIPGQSHTEGSASDPLGLRASEQASGPAYTDREKVFAIIPINLGGYADLNAKKTYYVCVTAADDSGTSRFDINLLSDLSSGDFRHQPDIFYGLPEQAYSAITGATYQQTEPMAVNVYGSQSTVQQALKDYLENTGNKNYLSWAVFSNSGKVYPLQWVYGKSFGDGSATKASSANMFAQGLSAVPGGVPTPYQLRNLSTESRLVEMHQIIGDSLNHTMKYTLNDTTVDTTYNDHFNQIVTSAAKHLDPPSSGASQVGRLDAAAISYSIQHVVIDDSEMKMDSSYKSIFIAAKKPIMAIVQEWQRNTNGTAIQYYDLTKDKYKPKDRNTTNYTEQGIPKRTCWSHWPSFTEGTALAKDSATSYNFQQQVTLGEADSGVLRKDTVYEITFSIFNKQYGFETNVGTPVRIQTDADDNVALSLFRQESSTPAVWPFVPSTSLQRIANFSGYGPIQINYQYGGNAPHHGNYLELRFYYRALGTFEWLPAGNIDFMDYFGNPNKVIFWICKGAVASLPGGQPGGFNDYSPLPIDDWDDVKVFQNRVFWSSKKSVNFSYADNPFAYPVRNVVPVQTGEYRGMTVHLFPGQSDQAGRIIFWGSDAMYEGSFSGVLTQQPILISPNATGTFAVEGSDFVVDERTTNTAFSHRSAVVADGILYYWGPKGIYMDDGVNFPVKISGALEPELSTWYDSNKIDEIHCSYNEATKEITWFYPPTSGDGTKTATLVLHKPTGEFFPGEINGKVDWAQPILLEDNDTGYEFAGKRTILGIREDDSEVIQRAVFYDDKCKAGDFLIKNEYLVKSVALVSGSTYRLTLASGYDATNFGALSVGDNFTIDAGSKYSNDSDVKDLLAKITAKGAGTIDFTLPSELSSFYTGSLTQGRYFPIWVPNNAIDYKMKTTLWTPGGLNYWALWKWLHMAFRVNLLPSDNAQTVNLIYNSLISSLSESNTITLTDNSIGHCQRWTHLKIGRESTQGQGIQLDLSGSHNGSEWVLQYLCAYSDPMDTENLMHFEG